jgi:hypothetical protein
MMSIWCRIACALRYLCLPKGSSYFSHVLLLVTRDQIILIQRHKGLTRFLIDDYHYTLSLTQFKELVSKNGHHVPCKGSKVPFVAKLLVILSNDGPDVWWPNQTGTEHYAAAQRRMQPPIGKVIKISSSLVKYYLHEDGHWHRKWLPGTRQLTQQIADFVSYDNREAVMDNDDELVGIPTPVPVIRETTVLPPRVV